MTAKKSTNKSTTLDSVIAQLEGLSINEILFAVSEATKEQQGQLKGFVSQAVTADIQSHLEAAGFVPTCPECGSTDSKKKGMRGKIQRYQCKHCVHKYTAVTRTILEKSGYTCGTLG